MESQRIEQRIGRCHRYGQKHDVVVVNFSTKERCRSAGLSTPSPSSLRVSSAPVTRSSGTIESGVDFERRIAQIYQDCRTEENTDRLRHPSEGHGGRDRRNDEYHETEAPRELRRGGSRSSRSICGKAGEYLSRYENWLWDVTRYYLAPYADFSSDDHSFRLKRNPFSGSLFTPARTRSETT